MSQFLSALIITFVSVDVIRARQENSTNDKLWDKHLDILKYRSRQPDKLRDFLTLAAVGSGDDKCFQRCEMLGMGFINPDGSINEDKVRHVMEMYLELERHQELYLNTLLKCDKECEPESVENNTNSNAVELYKLLYEKIKYFMKNWSSLISGPLP